MSYSKKLERFVLELKGGVFFLSPRERIFLSFLEEMGIPEHVVREGIENCYRAVNPRRRSKRPLFLCMGEIMEAYERFLRLEAQRLEIDWRRRFREKVELVKDLLKGEVGEPKSEEDAQRILKEIERQIVRALWSKMDPQQRRRIREKFKDFESRRDIYGELIKAEVKRLYNLPDLSLYVD